MSLPPSSQEMPVDGASSTVPSQGQFGTAVVKPLSALAVTALVLGIISLLLSWVPILNNLIFILALIATVVAIVAVVQTRPNKAHRGSGMAITSLVISILAIVVVFGSQAMYAKAIDEASGAASVAPSVAPSAGASPSSSGVASQPAEAAKASEDSNVAQLKNGKVTIEVKKVEKSVNDYEGKSTVAATLVITNNDTSNLNPFEYRVQAFQNKVELDTAIYFDAKPEGYEPMDALKELQPGGSMTVVSAFVLNDETAPVSLKIDSTFGSKKAFEKEYPLQ